MFSKSTSLSVLAIVSASFISGAYADEVCYIDDFGFRRCYDSNYNRDLIIRYSVAGGLLGLGVLCIIIFACLHHRRKAREAKMMEQNGGPAVSYNQTEGPVVFPVQFNPEQGGFPQGNPYPYPQQGGYPGPGPFPGPQHGLYPGAPQFIPQPNAGGNAESKRSSLEKTHNIV